MSIQVHWRSSLSASCLHAADALLRGRQLVDTKYQQILQEPAAALKREVAAIELPEALFWSHLTALSSQVENNKELISLVLRKMGRSPSEHAVSSLVAEVASIEAATLMNFPNLVDEMLLRSAPLREQWEARGVGLLNKFSELTDGRLIPETAEAILVKPALGGGGAAHLPYNSVRIEAVLANPIPELPEILRLGWLLSQLNNDLPIYSETIMRERLPMISNLAMIPPILLAAESVELAALNDSTLALALNSWPDPAHQDEQTLDILIRWWETYAAGRPPWGVALSALDKMLP